MLRQLLTLLAVISGFTLAAEPVSAAEGAVVSVASVSDIAECPVIPTASLQLVAEDQSASASAERSLVRCAVVTIAPTVQLQADRARE